VKGKIILKIYLKFIRSVMCSGLIRIMAVLGGGCLNTVLKLRVP
jgi:hypothetical protein